MPNYEYELIHKVTGEKLGSICLARPVAERDAVEVRRRTIPEAVRVTGAVPNPAAAGTQVMEAYRRLERRLGNNREFQQRIGHTAETIKRAWSAGRKP